MLAGADGIKVADSVRISFVRFDFSPGASVRANIFPLLNVSGGVDAGGI